MKWKIVAAKAACKDGSKSIGKFKTVSACAHACANKASMFVVRRGAYCKGGCQCTCMRNAKDGKCEVKSSKFQNLYAYL